ncbi:hypothetical protein [Neobacillus muris]|uniref:hypothetical protein n=1 Tax=Neobacillus muris TaxID=2941334 RepID=UPI00203D50C3|nr:hypothetical protein [Neobacillus muris]
MNNMYMNPGYLPYDQTIQYADNDYRLWGYGGFGFRPWGFGWGYRPWGFGFPPFGVGFGFPFFI